MKLNSICISNCTTNIKKLKNLKVELSRFVWFLNQKPYAFEPIFVSVVHLPSSLQATETS